MPGRSRAKSLQSESEVTFQTQLGCTKFRTSGWEPQKAEHEPSVTNNFVKQCLSFFPREQIDECCCLIYNYQSNFQLGWPEFLMYDASAYVSIGVSWC